MTDRVLQNAGLCGSCRNALLRPTHRGPVYLRCALAATDHRYAKYPQLPVLRCPGYQPQPTTPE